MNNDQIAMQIRPVLVVAVCLARSQQRHQVQQMLIGHLRMDKLGQLGHRHRNSSFVLVVAVVFAWNCWKRSVVAADVVVVAVFVLFWCLNLFLNPAVARRLLHVQGSAGAAL